MSLHVWICDICSKMIRSFLDSAFLINLSYWEHFQDNLQRQQIDNTNSIIKTFKLWNQRQILDNPYRWQWVLALNASFLVQTADFNLQYATHIESLTL